MGEPVGEPTPEPMPGSIEELLVRSPWAGLEALAPANGGSRSQVWRGRLGPRAVSIRRTGRRGPSFEWELDLLEELTGHGFVVPTVVAADDGRRHVDGWVVQEWLDGAEPASERDWRLVAAELLRLHRLTVDHQQRPGCCRVDQLGPVRRSVDADLDAMPEQVRRRVLAEFASVSELDVDVAVIHGDPDPGNIRLDGEGRVGLLDWDESRVDLVWHDLSNLGVAVLDPQEHARAEALSNAWEAANGWVAEPAYAARRFQALDETTGTEGV